MAATCKRGHAPERMLLVVDRNGRQMSVCRDCRANAARSRATLGTVAPKPAIARLMRRMAISRDTGCWTAAFPHNGHGYVAISVSTRPRRNNYAHRISYEYFRGPVPDGMEIDHLCRNRACFYPPHLEAVSHKVNVRRRRAATTPQSDTHGTNLWQENAELLAAWIRRLS